MKVIAGSVVAWTAGSRLRNGAGDDVGRGGLPRRVPTSEGSGVGEAAGGAVWDAASATGGCSGADGFFAWVVV